MHRHGTQEADAGERGPSKAVNEDLASWARGRALRAVIGLIIYQGALLAIAGRWLWPQAWLLLAIQVAAWSATLRTVYATNPSLLRERAAATRHANTQRFDRVLFPAFFALTLAASFAAALEQRLRPGRRCPLAAQAAALIAFVAAIALEAAAMITNHWFSSVVRLQPERGQRVCSAGVYSKVRHPAYAGVLLQAAAEWVLLGSWAGAFCAARATVMVVRAALEDAFLQRELPGYREYARRVRWRLLPGVW